jgi:hypothetical protein
MMIRDAEFNERMWKAVRLGMEADQLFNVVCVNMWLDPAEAVKAPMETIARKMGRLPKPMVAWRTSMDALN